MVAEVREAFRAALPSCIAGRGNWFKLSQLLLLIFLVVGFIVASHLQIAAGEGVRSARENGTRAYIEFYEIAVICRFLQFCLGRALISQTFRELLILRLLPSVGPSLQAIGQTLTNAKVLRFLMFLLYMVNGIGLEIYIGYGSESDAYSSSGRSILAAYLFVWGDWDLESLTQVEGAWGTLIFLLLSFVITGTLASISLLLSVSNTRIFGGVRPGLDQRGEQPHVPVVWARVLTLGQDVT